MTTTDARALLPDPSARLVAAYREVDVRMRGLPFHNPALEVEAVGFAPWGAHWLGVLVTPWFMNVALAPRDPAGWRPLAFGEKRRYGLPAGAYDFIGASDASVGELLICSLFSPVLHLADQPTARVIAQLARDALMDPANAEGDERDRPLPTDDAKAALPGPGPIEQVQRKLDAPMSRRELLRGRFLPTTSHDDRG